MVVRIRSVIEEFTKPRRQRQQQRHKSADNNDWLNEEK